MVSLSGLGSGLDTESMINQLVALERQRVTVVETRSAQQTSAISSYATLRAGVAALRTAAQRLAAGSDWNALVATSSDDAVGVTATNGTFTGAMSFRVTALAAAGAVRSANTITGLATRVTTGSAIFVAAGGREYGFSSLAADDTVAIGSHAIAVTQSSGGAVKSGAAAVAASTIIDGTNDQLQLTVNGAANTITITAGTYDRAQLTAAVQAALDAQGVGATVALDAANQISLTTTSEGSTATLRVTGGTAITPLALTTDASDLVGVDGKISVDGNAVQTFGDITAIAPGDTITLAAGAGNITAVLSGGLRAGTITGNQVTVGDGSLGAVVSAINGARAGVTAAAVQVGNNVYRLQLAATITGADHDPNLALAEFDSSVVGSLTTLTQGADATLTVGSGAGQYTVASATNSISDLLPGLSVTLAKVTAGEVTITLDRDVAGLADKVADIVAAANALRAEVDKATAYDAATKQASPLTGDSTTRRLVSEITAAITNAVPGAAPGSPGLAGVSTSRDGKFTFDRTKFVDAFNDDPAGMTKLFSQSSSATNGWVTLVASGDRAVAGTYPIAITTAAEQAALLSAGLPAAGTTIRSKIGTIEAAYTVQPGDTLATTVSGLNAAFAAASLAVTASIDGPNIRTTASAYGSATTVEVAWDGSTWVSDAGVDVAGTINGVAGSGSGQRLTIDTTDTTVGGLAILYTGSATGALGTLTYNPGIAQRISSVGLAATDSFAGYLTSAENARKSSRDLIDRQVETMEARLTTYENRLRRQFASLETAMANLRSQQSWLSGQLAGLG